MDIHRCRFVPFPPSAINALAFSHASNPSKAPPPTLRLAVGHANGDIEIWNPLKGAWFQESILRGGKDRSIESLAWIQDPEDVDRRGHKVPGKLRLFSIGYSEVVTEWDLAAGKPLRHSSGNRGEIWCMATQPKDAPPEKLDSRSEDEHRDLEVRAQAQCIAVGCADGSIVLLSTIEEDLRFHKILARPGKKKTRVLSLTFQDRHTIIAGHADSTIRVYDIRGGTQIKNMTLGGGPAGGPKETLVWAVKCLKDGTIVSGDSNGVLSLWDGKHYALMQRIQGHEADVLDLAVSTDGRTIFSGSIDRRTTLYQKASRSQTYDEGRWAKSSHVRIHQNDVKAMATFEASKFGVMASGGLDTNPVVVPIQQFNKEEHRTLSALPQRPPMASAPGVRLMVSWSERELRVWSLGNPLDTTDMDRFPGDSNIDYGQHLLTKILVQGDENITSASIDSAGRLLAVATVAETKLFRLQLNDSVLKVRRQPLPENLSQTGARIMNFSPDGHWLILITPQNVVELLRIVHQDDTKRGVRIHTETVNLPRLYREPISQKLQHGSLGRYDRFISNVAVSSDSQILAVCDIAGYIDTWLLEGHEDLEQTEKSDRKHDEADFSEPDSASDDEVKPVLVYGQQWVRNPSASSIMKIATPPLVMSFRPSSSNPLQSLTNGTAGLHPTRHNPHPHSHDLPAGEDRLIIITADNYICELNVLAGRLSSWSRRNPWSLFPTAYRNLRDPAKGLIWDISASRSRIWVYGVNWLWMFDLSMDFPDPNDGRLKRKRESDNDNVNAVSESSSVQPRPRGSGAGSKRRASELNSGIDSTVRKIEGSDSTNPKLITLEPSSNPDLSSGDDDYDGGHSTALLSLRRREADADVMDIDFPSDAEEKQKPKFMHWHTFKYRPILGIIPIGERNAGEGGSVEVAIVERPLWDVDMPAKYLGEKEWEH